MQTRRGADKWRLRVNNLDPSFRTERGTLFQILGIQSFYPRLQVGGPLIKDKVFLQQAFQYRYRANDIASRPQDELRVSQRFASFTRVDATLSERHSLVAGRGHLSRQVPATRTSGPSRRRMPPSTCTVTRTPSG